MSSSDSLRVVRHELARCYEALELIAILAHTPECRGCVEISRIANETRWPQLKIDNIIPANERLYP